MESPAGRNERASTLDVSPSSSLSIEIAFHRAIVLADMVVEQRGNESGVVVQGHAPRDPFVSRLRFGGSCASASSLPLPSPLS